MRHMPVIRVDADSCPRQVRDIIVRAAERTGITVIFVANRPIPLKRSDSVNIRIVQNPGTTADDVILYEALPGDIIITRDIPLASRMLEKSCIVMNDRGLRFTTDTIRERLSLRDVMKEARETGLAEEGKRTFGRREVHAFAAELDRTLAEILKNIREGRE